MKISQNVERGITIMLILALTKEQKALSSSTISQLIEVPDSSTKKLLTKLSKAQLIQAVEGKEGGFLLKRSLEEISVLDVWLAMEEQLFDIRPLGLSNRIFTIKEQINQSRALFYQQLEKAGSAFSQVMAELMLIDFLIENYQEKRIDWMVTLEEKRNGKN